MGDTNDAHLQLINTFYEAFARKDAEAMAACYADDVSFSDPVFVGLQGEEARDMWRMLCERGKDLKVVFSDVRADSDEGHAHWEATYTFTATGKKVHNVIDARFTFRDGRIVEHVDTFDLRAWMSQALGAKGMLLGWLPPVQGALRKQARKGLDSYRARR